MQISYGFTAFDEETYFTAVLLIRVVLDDC